MNVLDNPAWHAMTGPQSAIAEVVGSAGRFVPEISPFSAMDGSPDGWRDLEALSGAEPAVVFGVPAEIPDGWSVQGEIPCLQFVAGDLRPRSDLTFERLTPDDAPDMLALAKATNPGPFRIRTIEMGTYLGLRSGGRLVAMAGERVKPPGYTEISAVCTDEQHRRKGLARELTLAVAQQIRDRGDEAFLHVMTTNTSAIGLYRAIGFELRRDDLVVAVMQKTAT